MQNLDKLKVLASELPESVKGNAEALVERMGEVIEGISDKPLEWRPSFLKVMQGTSDRSKTPKGATIGSLILGEEVVEAPYPVIPIRTFTTRQKWNPDPEVNKIECQSPDGETGFKFGKCKLCEFQKFDEEAGRTACNKTITVLQISGDLSKIFTANFSKSNYSKGTDWQKAMKMAGVAPYKRTYRLKSETSSKSKNVELLVAETYAGNNTDKALWPFLEELSFISGEDRKQHLRAFQEYIENKASSMPALENHEQDDTVVLLDAATPEVVEVIEATDSVEKQSKKYKM